MNSPLLSIITVNLNNAEGLAQTIRSVTEQSFDQYEFIVIDGGSSDASLAVIGAAEEKISCWVSEPDRGIYHAMNKGIARARGVYCLFLNSGDYLAGSRVLAEVFKNSPGADLLVGACTVVADENTSWTVRPAGPVSLQTFMGATLPHQATFIRRQLFADYGPYVEDYAIHADYEFWLRVLIRHNCSVAMLDTVVSYYNLDGISANPAHASRSAAEQEQILSRTIPARIRLDYGLRRREKEAMAAYYWIDQKPVFRQVIGQLFWFAQRFAKLKRRLKVTR